VDVDIIWSDRGTMARRTASQNPPAAGGWNMFVSAAGAAMYDPLTNLGTDMSCDLKNSAGWPCDEHAEELRQAFLDASEGDKPAALDRLHRHLAQVEPYRVLGQFEQPVALRANIIGLLTSPVIVYWNVEKH
jgi:peptide/nickel transport system substrate-binding protein